MSTVCQKVFFPLVFFRFSFFFSNKRWLLLSRQKSIPFGVHIKILKQTTLCLYVLRLNFYCLPFNCFAFLFLNVCIPCLIGLSNENGLNFFFSLKWNKIRIVTYPQDTMKREISFKFKCNSHLMMGWALKKDWLGT